MVQRLRNRLDANIPRVLGPLKEKARSYKSQAEQSASIEESRTLAKQALNCLEQIRSLQGLDENSDRLFNESDKLLREVTRLETELTQARTAYENRKVGLHRQPNLSQVVRHRYPGDPGVTPAQPLACALFYAAGNDPLWINRPGCAGPGRYGLVWFWRIQRLPDFSDTHGDPHRHSYRYRHGDAHIDRYRHAYPHPNQHLHPHPNPDCCCRHAGNLGTQQLL